MTATDNDRTAENGVNTQALLEAREVLKGAPEAAQFTWRATSTWKHGVHSATTIQNYFGLGQEQQHKRQTTFDADHPEIFAATDNCITPIEYLLVGLAGCLTAGVASVAQNRGIQLRSVEATVEGEHDIRGILGADPDVRNGFNDVKVTFTIDADASKQEIEALVAQSQKRSAVFDALTNPTNVTVEVASEGVEPAVALGDSRAIERVTTVVIGAGHAGLAASHQLRARSIDHVVLERGDVANSWRTERWDSLRLLTPNWLSRLPGHRYDGPDPDGYMTMSEVADFIERFAAGLRAPVRTGTNVTSVRRADDGYQVRTSGGDIGCRTVVVASGAFNRPTVPSFSEAVPASVTQLTPFDYRGPDQLADGGVLVVGASATGVQLAAELARSGRPVTLAVGEHVRMPRTYRGRDVLWWMDRTGVWDERYDEVDDLTRARRLPSPQLVGTPERTTLDLNALADLGVELVGRWAAVRDDRALFSGGLRNVFSLADLKLERRLDAFDEWAQDHGRGADVGPPERYAPTRVPTSARWQLDLRSGEISDDRVGDRVSARLSMARCARGRREGQPAPRRRHGRQPRNVRARAPCPATAQVDVHPRHRGRCA